MERGTCETNAEKPSGAARAGHEYALVARRHDLAKRWQFLNRSKSTTRIGVPAVWLFFGRKNRGRPDFVGLRVGIGRDEKPYTTLNSDVLRICLEIT